MKRARRRSTEKEAYWRKVVADHSASGLSVRKYCSQHDLHESQFYAWRREIALRDRESIGEQPHQDVPFLPVHVIGEEVNNSDCPIELVSPDGWCLRMSSGASSAQAAELFRQLQHPTCC